MINLRAPNTFGGGKLGQSVFHDRTHVLPVMSEQMYFSESLSDSGIFEKIFDFDIFGKDKASKSKDKNVLQGRRPYQYKTPEQIAANSERYQTNFTTSTGPGIKVFCRRNLTELFLS